MNAMENTETKQSARIQTSLLNPSEKVILRALARRIPLFVTSDHLTAIGVLGAVIVLVGYALTIYSPAWLWLANAGFFINWFGDWRAFATSNARSTASTSTTILTAFAPS